MPDSVFDPVTERLDEINERVSLISLKKGLTFGTDSYLLAAFTREKKNGTAVELGGGTGVVSLLCAARKKYQTVYCAELQPYFAELITRNAALNSLADTVRSVQCDVRVLSPVLFGGEVDAVFSNPPYLRKDSGKTNASDEMNTARREENGTVSDFCACASRLLKYGGTFSVVYRPDRLTELLVSLRENGLETKKILFVYPSADKKPCLVLVEAKKGAAEGNVVARPLIIYEDKQSSRYTADMTKIYDDFSLSHLF